MGDRLWSTGCEVSRRRWCGYSAVFLLDGVALGITAVTSGWDSAAGGAGIGAVDGDGEGATADLSGLF